MVLRNSERGIKLGDKKSRAEYMKLRRENRKHFSVLLDKGKVEQIEKKLAEMGKTKTEWVEEKIDEELRK